MTAAHHVDEDSPDFIVDTLQDLAKESTSRPEAAQLRVLAHLARVSSKTERRLGAVEKAIARLEGLEGRNADQERRLTKIETFVTEKQAEVRGGWFVAVKVAAILTFIASVAGIAVKLLSK